MGAIQLPDELQHKIERQVAEGRAASTSAFVEEAVLRLIDDAHLEEQAVVAAAPEGIADIEAGRFTTVSTSEDEQALHKRLMSRLRASAATQR